jgi:hypothetical protein
MNVDFLIRSWAFHAIAWLTLKLQLSFSVEGHKLRRREKL